MRFKPGKRSSSQRLHESNLGAPMWKKVCRVCGEELWLRSPHVKCEEKALESLPNQRHPKS
jgi:hypothetical protein